MTWSIARSFDHAYIRNIEDCAGEIVAQVLDLDDYANDLKRARLIAAAPDLLAALKALTFTARTFRNVSQDEQMWTSIDEDALRSAFDAIAKAEGEA